MRRLTGLALNHSTQKQKKEGRREGKRRWDGNGASEEHRCKEGTLPHCSWWVLSFDYPFCLWFKTQSRDTSWIAVQLRVVTASSRGGGNFDKFSYEPTTLLVVQPRGRVCNLSAAQPQQLAGSTKTIPCFTGVTTPCPACTFRCHR